MRWQGARLSAPNPFESHPRGPWAATSIRSLSGREKAGPKLQLHGGGGKQGPMPDLAFGNWHWRCSVPVRVLRAWPVPGFSSRSDTALTMSREVGGSEFRQSAVGVPRDRGAPSAVGQCGKQGGWPIHP